MKTLHPALFPVGLVLALMLLTSSFLPAASLTVPVPSSIVSLTVGSLTNSVAITNTGDQVWLLQSSGDLVNWTERGAWKIHNGYYRGSFSRDASAPQLFY